MECSSWFPSFFYPKSMFLMRGDVILLDMNGVKHRVCRHISCPLICTHLESTECIFIIFAWVWSNFGMSWLFIQGSRLATSGTSKTGWFLSYSFQSGKAKIKGNMLPKWENLWRVWFSTKSSLLQMSSGYDLIWEPSGFVMSLGCPWILVSLDLSFFFLRTPYLFCLCICPNEPQWDPPFPSRNWTVSSG